MIIQTHTLLAVLAIVACADGSLLRRGSSASTTNFAISNSHHTHTHVRTTSTPSHGFHLPTKETTPFPTNVFTTGMEDPKSLETLPSTTYNTVTSIQDNYPSTGTSPTTPTITSTKEPHVPVHSSYFTTDALSSSSIMNLPENETESRVLFWPPSPGITVTLNIGVAGWNYTFTANTTLPQHWHSIDILQVTSERNGTSINLNTDGRYINLGFSRVLHIQVGSDNTTHWFFCPHAHLCTLLSPLEHGGSESSGERTDLLAALLVVAFLLIVTLLALGGVTFYRKNELFHIYAKPIDCLPYTPPPPPLPRPNKEPARHAHGEKEATQIEAEKTELTDDLGYSRVSADTRKTVPPTRLKANSTQSSPCERLKEHESINCLYGLV